MKLFHCLLYLLFPCCLFAQRIAAEKTITLVLPDSTKVTLHEALPWEGEQASKLFYYRPNYLRFSTKKDSTPEFSLLTYRETDEGEISGGILHWLITWGLTPRQEAEIQRLLREQVDSNSVLMGAIPVEPAEANSSFEIISKNNDVADILRRSLNSKGAAPTFPGGKLAASFHFSAADAQVVEKAFQDSSKLEGIEIQLQYTCRLFQNGGEVIWKLIISRSLDDMMRDILEKPKTQKSK